MTTYFFDLVVDRDLMCDIDPLFEVFDADVSPAVMNGVPLLMCSVEAESVEQAVRPTVARLREMGIEVRQVRFEPDAVLA